MLELFIYTYLGKYKKIDYFLIGLQEFYTLQKTSHTHYIFS